MRIAILAEFESSHPSHAVQSLRCDFRVCVRRGAGSSGCCPKLLACSAFQSSACTDGLVLAGMPTAWGRPLP
jgi:hypothetical protein